MNGLQARFAFATLFLCLSVETSIRAQQPDEPASSPAPITSADRSDQAVPPVPATPSPQSPIPSPSDGEQPPATPSQSVAPAPVPSLAPPSPSPFASFAPTTQPTSMLDSLLGQSRARSRGPMNRFARTPEFFGDILVGGDSVVDTGLAIVRNDLPLAASSRRAKIADHNKAYPVDRAFINYHHFSAAQNQRRSGVLDENAVDRFTVGFEKTYDQGRASVEFRLPFAERFTIDDPDYRLVGGNVGNLAIIFKRLIHQTQTRAIAAGIGFDTPTGSDVRGELPLQGVEFEVDNDSIHLLPYIGVVGAPGDLFYHMSFQLDIPINGNTIETDTGGLIERGVLDETSFFYFDISAGYWFFRESCRCPGRGRLGLGRLTGLAGVVEYHLNSTLGDGDFVTLGTGFASFGTPQDLGISNLTIGLHAELDYHTKLRVGGAFPLSEEPERFFDGEFMLSLIRHF
ncbi:hypothetical protein Mal15_26920 [Stieleria maiorica]|uniref:Uncharacterized protein n=1 Tax=Stieleria maiorica TaxID=2795974 RepID=A0A5B9MHT8_9BACT|nr:hypothetical protein [Stieleria maiorica]QEF98637.1 hypothetical protein Mal15_26920 [Stieleria maiorica]